MWAPLPKIARYPSQAPFISLCSSSLEASRNASQTRLPRFTSARMDRKDQPVEAQERIRAKRTLPEEIEGFAIRLEPRAKTGISSRPGDRPTGSLSLHGHFGHRPEFSRSLAKHDPGILVVGNPNGAKCRNVERLADIWEPDQQVPRRSMTPHAPTNTIPTRTKTTIPSCRPRLTAHRRNRGCRLGLASPAPCTVSSRMSMTNQAPAH